MLSPNPDPLSRSFDDVFEQWIRQYRKAGRPIHVNFRELVGANSGVDRFTHLLHPYPAKLLFNIPLLFLNCGQLGRRQESLYDPFCGSGTVLLEGLISGRHVWGSDANPLARLISAAKITLVSAASLRDCLEATLAGIPTRGSGAPSGVIDLERWFSPKVLRHLDRLATAIRQLPTSPERTFIEACFSALTTRVSLADPTLSVPVRLNPRKPGLTSAQRKERRRWLKERTDADVFSRFREIVTANVLRMERLSYHLAFAPTPNPILRDSRVEKCPDPIDLIITSPPYGSAQKYIRASSLGLQWLGLAPNGLRPLEKLVVGREHYNVGERHRPPQIVAKSSASVLDRIARKNALRSYIAANFLAEMDLAFATTISTLRPGGHLVLVVGDNFVCGELFDNRKYLTEICVRLGLELRLTLIDQIRSRGLITKRNTTAGLISHEWVLVFRKPGGNSHV